MASVVSKLMTAEEFFDWVQRPENRDRHFELEAGEVVEVSRPDERHCVVCGNASGILWNYTRRQKTGHICTNDMGLILERDPDTVRGADLALYLEPRRFHELAVKYPPRLPKLIVEVLSPNDRFPKMLKRINKFLEKGVAMVWLLDPEVQTIHVFLPNQLTIVLEGDEELTGQNILPDYSHKVSEFFSTASD